MNEIRGAELGVELYDLYAASHVVAEMANVYHGANQAVAETIGSDTEAFADVIAATTDINYSGASLGGAWREFRDLLMDIFAETNVNLSRVSAELVSSVNEYAGGDDAAAKALAAKVDRSNEHAQDESVDPEGDENLPELPKVDTDGEGPVVNEPSVYDNPTTSEGNLWSPPTARSRSTGTRNWRG